MKKNHLHKHSLPALLLIALAKGLVISCKAFSRNYSYRKLYRDIEDLHDTFSFRAKTIPPSTFFSTLSRLKRQGLVTREGKRGQSVWNITEKGREQLQTFENSQNSLHMPEPDGVTRLVIFDIPERERKKRDSLRAELLACAYQPLQKSVWMGNHPLPEDFIFFLDDLDLTGKVHIFSVREKGTIGETE